MEKNYKCKGYFSEILGSYKSKAVFMEQLTKDVNLWLENKGGKTFIKYQDLIIDKDLLQGILIYSEWVIEDEE